MSKIYLIKELWTDSSENDIHSAVGYKIIGYTLNERLAKELHENGGILEKGNWPVLRPMSNIIYEEISEINPKSLLEKKLVKGDEL